MVIGSNKILVLASQSKRRIEILKKFIYDLVIIKPEYEEALLDDPIETVYMNSRGKVYSVLNKAPPNSIVIGVDTVIYDPEHGVIGKPSSIVEARNILWKLRGKWHSVYSGVYIVRKNDQREYFFHEETRVKFRMFSHDELEKYLSTLEPLGKAGGYAIQELGSLLVEEIHGDFYNVIGLPITKLYIILKEQFGFDLLEYYLGSLIVKRPSI
ncbi:MAG: septum formation protein Maf [Desulfurococcales archaeon ex4484_58]|nr:MAG: septum formation protein Maf [Desulfurococcales archaeon ex4484_58]